MHLFFHSSFIGSFSRWEHWGIKTMSLQYKSISEEIVKRSKTAIFFVLLDCLVVSSNSFVLQMGEIIFRRTIAISIKDLKESYFLNQTANNKFLMLKTKQFFKHFILKIQLCQYYSY